MELMFGTDVREHGHRAGRLAGFEVDAASRRVRKLIFSTDGELGSHALARPFSTVAGKDGNIEIRDYTPSEEPPPPAAVLLSHSTRIVRGGREVGRLAGITVSDAGALQSIVGRRNWWTRRFLIDAATSDISVSGEIRAGASATRAA